ncbi:MAG: TIGR01777 family oxidoreductase [Bacteroidales bacterium]
MENRTRVGITGSTGFIGKELTRFLNENRFEVIQLGRGFDLEVASDCDILINLAGATINKRWSDSYKYEIVNSRINTTEKVVDSIKRSNRVKLLINASAVGIYEQNNITVHTENSTALSESFLGDVCRKWEGEAMNANSLCRVVIMRLGVVLSEKGGALKKMSMGARFGIAAVAGSGKQFISWIMLNDLLRAIHFIIINNSLSGVVNMSTPNLLTNYELTKIISKKYHSFLTIHIPESLFKMSMGESSEIVLKGVKVIPEKLLESGFIFENPVVQL